MKRINIYKNNEEYKGWFDRDAAEEIASYTKGDLYKHGKILLATAKGKLVINSWDGPNYDVYRFAEDEAEIAEILSRDPDYNSQNNTNLNKKLKKILETYEI